MTTGRVYQSVIQNERSLKYRGACVQVVPHVPNEVIERVERVAKNENSDIVFIEIGGTVGEYENILFLEAVRMMQHKYNKNDQKNVAIAMVSYLPSPQTIGEVKTKPTQHAVREVNSVGLQPDIIIARSAEKLDNKRKEKISQFCNVEIEDVISAPDVKSIYEIPENFRKENVHGVLLSKLGLIKNGEKVKTDLSKWNKFFKPLSEKKSTVKVAIVGKYFESGESTLSDSYLSVIEAVKHAACCLNTYPEIHWLSAEKFEKREEKLETLSNFDAVIVPGGFGSRGVEGKIKAIEYVRKNKIPFLGICYGMQLAVIETMRNVAGHKDANTTEVNPKTKAPVIAILESQKQLMKDGNYGNTMRLGNYIANLKKGSLVEKLYKSNKIEERHRHRYEVDPKYHEEIEKSGLKITGTSPDGTLAEVVEMDTASHPYFVACQFHPEFLSRPLAPHPLFVGLIKAGLK
jgi:CTP synthase